MNWRFKGANGVGRFTVDFEVANDADLGAVQLGLLAPDKVRRMTIRGVVDSGATRLVLPLSVVKRLGLPVTGKITVRYADRRTGKRDTVDRVHVELLGRSSTFKALVEPRRRTALIGAIVLEDLDFLVDCTNQRLVPRNPKYIISEIE